MEESKFRLPRGVGGSETSQPIHLKFGMFDYVRRSTPYAKYEIRWSPQMGDGVGIGVKLYLQHAQLTLRSVNLRSMQSKTCFGGRFAQVVKSFPFNPKNIFQRAE